MTRVQIKRTIFEEEISESNTDGSNNDDLYQNDKARNEMNDNEALQKKTYTLSEIKRKPEEDEEENRENVTFWELLKKAKSYSLEKIKGTGEQTINFFSFDYYEKIKPRLPLIIAILVTLICFGNIIDQKNDIF